MKTRIIKIYYLCLAALVLAATFKTIYTGSIHVSSGRDLAKLEKQQLALTNHKQQLEQQIALAGSLSSINQFALNQQFQPMVAPIPITITSSMMASR